MKCPYIMTLERDGEVFHIKDTCESFHELFKLSVQYKAAGYKVRSCITEEKKYEQ